MATRDVAWTEGSPCMVACRVDDTDEAAEFYGTLFGWDVGPAEETEGGYRIATMNGRQVAAIGALPDGSLARASWLTCFAADDLGTAALRSRAAGGSVVAEGTALGRLTVAADPAGAAYGLWGADHLGIELYGEPGALCWTELNTRGRDVAREFYGSVLGFEYDGAGDVLLPDGERIGAIHELEPDLPPEVPSAWEPWFAVEGCDDLAASAGGLGATVRSGPRDSTLGRLALLQAPQGENFGIVELSRPRSVRRSRLLDAATSLSLVSEVTLPPKVRTAAG